MIFVSIYFTNTDKFQTLCIHPIKYPHRCPLNMIIIIVVKINTYYIILKAYKRNNIVPIMIDNKNN